MVEAAGADLVDINFGCPVRKVTKTGAGATLLDDPDLACRIVSAVADAVDLPVSVKMRRGLRERLPRLPERRPAPRRCRSLGSHPAPALGAADVHRHGRSQPDRRARLARRRAGDRLGRHHLARPGADRARDDGSRRGDGRPRSPGQPLGARARSSTATRRDPSREEVVAELVLFIRETVRELGERRAAGFLKKFYAWYLGRGRFPRPFKQELVVLDSTEEVERRLIAAAPGALRADRAARGRAARRETRSRSPCRSRPSAAARRPRASRGRSSRATAISGAATRSGDTRMGAVAVS